MIVCQSNLELQNILFQCYIVDYRLIIELIIHRITLKKIFHNSK